MAKRKVRVCAHCEWIFRSHSPECPICRFGSYGAWGLYGSKAYKYLKTQKLWKDRKLMCYESELDREIISRRIK